MSGSQAAFQESDVPERLAKDAVKALEGFSLLVDDAETTIFRSILEMDPKDMRSLMGLDLQGCPFMAAQNIKGFVVHISSAYVACA